MRLAESPRLGPAVRARAPGRVLNRLADPKTSPHRPPLNENADGGLEFPQCLQLHVFAAKADADAGKPSLGLLTA